MISVYSIFLNLILMTMHLKFIGFRKLFLLKKLNFQRQIDSFSKHNYSE